jgi:tetratricopeptide (TPR) repeat protein
VAISARRFLLVPTFAVTLAVVLAACSSGDSLEIDGLGAVSFPTSGMKEAREPFLRGVLLLHAFRYDEAADAFRRAQAADPTFALAYWGEALTYDRPMTGERLRGPALNALARLAPTPDERSARAATERERSWLYAAELLFGPADSEVARAGYREAMAALAARYPDDVEARVFDALARLAGDPAAATAEAVAGELEEVAATNPAHPGAAHYQLLAYARPGLAARGLAAARAYAGTGSQSPDILHTISKILLANGVWDAAVPVAEAAHRGHRERQVWFGRPDAVCDEYAALLQYGYLMQDKADAAAGLLEACQERVRGEHASPAEAAFYVAMRARQVIDTRDWTSARERWTADVGAAAWTRVPYDFVTAFALLRAHEPDAAAAFVRPLARLGDAGDVTAHDRLLLDLLDAALLLEKGQTEQALKAMRQAVTTEDGLTRGLALPAVLLPARELLAESLIQLGRIDEARAVLSEALARSPGRKPVVDALSGPG